MTEPDNTQVSVVANFLLPSTLAQPRGFKMAAPTKQDVVA